MSFAQLIRTVSMDEPFVLQAVHWIQFHRTHAIFTMTTCSTSKHRLFGNRHLLTWGRTFAGVVLASEEGKRIAKALGDKRAALLGNHGLLTIGQSIEETVAMFVLLDKCCEVQLAADASSAGSGKPLVKIGEVEAKATWEAIGTHASGYCKPNDHSPSDDNSNLYCSSRVATLSSRGA
jgi:ribulose-5-phosphate 4-epimerase/fuculose-1-phosphate aldolase